jgi:hypothetical protein
VGGFAAGEVAFADDAEQLALDGGEVTVFPEAAVGAADGVQQVEMG